MQETFVLEDLLNTMITLEGFGNENYKRLSVITKNLQLKEYFGILADMELKHKAIFEGFKAECVQFPEPVLDEEYLAYLKSLLSNALRFMKLVSVSDLVGDVVDDFDTGYDLAVTLEKDAILFLIEIKTLIPPRHHEVVDRLIKEERSHLQYLYAYREGL